MNRKISSIKELFHNNIRDTLSREEIDQIRTNIHKKEVIYNFLTKKDKLARKESKVLHNINIYFTELHDDLLKQNIYDYNSYALDLLFNKDDYYKPIEIKSAFNAKYVLYESNDDKDGLLYVFEYFEKIKPYLRDLIDFYNSKGEWKIQLSMTITFISYTDANQTQLMHSKSDIAESMQGIDANDTFISKFLQRYQEGLENKMKGSNYIFDHVDSLEYHFHKVTLNRGSSYIPSPDWLLHKKSTINPFNDQYNRCFLYAIVIALNHQNIANNPHRIVNLIPFIAKYSWNDIDFPARHKDYSAFEKNNTDIALNILFTEHNTKEIRQCHMSKHNNTQNNHVNVLMITDGTGKWHYLAIKSKALLRGITSNHNG